MMIARQKPLRSPRLLATNYAGQNFPAVGARARSKEGEMRDVGVFDRVLCDVPCRYPPLCVVLLWRYAPLCVKEYIPCACL
jgi:hypothetical protein